MKQGTISLYWSLSHFCTVISLPPQVHFSLNILALSVKISTNPVGAPPQAGQRYAMDALVFITTKKTSKIMYAIIIHDSTKKVNNIKERSEKLVSSI